MSIQLKREANKVTLRLRLDFAFLLAGLLCCRSSLGAPDRGTYHSYNLPPYVYLYAGNDANVIEDLDRELRNIVPEMELLLGTRLPDKIQIELPLTKSDFMWLTPGSVPDWAGGVAIPTEGRIVVKTPLFFDQNVPLSILTAHELAHILIDAASGGHGMPRWFNEGFAQVLSGESRIGYSSRLARAALADRLMGLPRVDGVLGFSVAEAELAYAESHAAAQSLLDRYGWEVVRNMLFMVGSGSQFDRAFLESSGTEYEVWQSEWLESAQQRYKHYAFLDTDTIIWVFIMLLSSVTVVVVWFRKRRQFKKWQDEEAEELPNDRSHKHEEKSHDEN